MPTAPQWARRPRGTGLLCCAVCWRSSIPGLERIRALLALMGDPQRDMKFILSLIHISEPTRP